MGCYDVKTGMAIYLISDTTLLETVEQSKRGGNTFVGSERYGNANNNY